MKSAGKMISKLVSSHFSLPVGLLGVERGQSVSLVRYVPNGKRCRCVDLRQLIVVERVLSVEMLAMLTFDMQ